MCVCSKGKLQVSCLVNTLQKALLSQEIFTMLNNLHPKLQFTMETSMEKLPFLDVLIYKEEGKILTDIYYKGTDSHQYINFDSCHPKHTKYNIPYTLSGRICAIVKRKETRDKRLQEFQKLLRKQNYPDWLIRKGIEKSKKLNIDELRTPKQNTEDKSILPLVFTHNPNNPRIVRKVKESLKFLSNNAEMKKHPRQNRSNYKSPATKEP